MQRIENTARKLAIIIEDDGTFVLEKGSLVSKETKKSLSPALKSLRGSGVLDGLYKTTKDLAFSSLSGMASFIQGAQTNGKAYFGSMLNKVQQEQTAAKPKKQPKAEAEQPTPTPTKVADDEIIEHPTAAQMAAAAKAANDIQVFCQDLQFKPDPRLLNALRFTKDEKEAAELIINSMELIGMPSEIIADGLNKFKNPEWKSLFQAVKACPLTHGKINNRLAILYGPAGTGKTSLAIAENPTAARIVASATQDPSELFTRNVVNDHGGVDVVLTELGQAMVDGKPIIIDELNLYQSCVLTRLQGVTDNTKRLTDNGVDITIKDGFKIIATMNLETNLGKNALPNPLVSRASEIIKLEDPFLGWIF